MNVKKDAAVSLLVELGIGTAPSWPVKRIEKKLEVLPKLVELDGLEPTSRSAQLLLKKIAEAVERKESVSVVDAGTRSAKPRLTETVSANDRIDEELENDLEDELEEEEEEDNEEMPAVATGRRTAKAPAKKRAQDQDGDTNGSNRPGIVNAIRQIMLSTSESKPITKERIVELLLKKFPDRNERSLMKTTVGQVSYFLRHKPPKGLPKLDIRLKGRGEGYFCAGEVQERQASTAKSSKEAGGRRKRQSLSS